MKASIQETWNNIFVLPFQDATPSGEGPSLAVCLWSLLGAVSLGSHLATHNDKPQHSGLSQERFIFSHITTGQRQDAVQPDMPAPLCSQDHELSTQPHLTYTFCAHSCHFLLQLWHHVCIQSKNKENGGSSIKVHPFHQEGNSIYRDLWSASLSLLPHNPQHFFF